MNQPPEGERTWMMRYETAMEDLSYVEVLAVSRREFRGR